MTRKAFSSTLCILLLSALFLYSRPAGIRDALSLRTEALELIKQGQAREAMAKLSAAASIFEKEGDSFHLSLCLYEMAIEFVNAGDLENLEGIIGELRSLDTSSAEPMVRFNHTSVASAWHHLKFLDNPSLISSRDSAIIYGRRSLDALELIDSPFDYNLQPVWNWYNQALYYDSGFDEPVVDSIEYYLNGAERWLPRLKTDLDRKESLISIEDLRAWVCLYKEDYEGARRKMLSVLDLIEEVEEESPGTVVTEKSEALKFLVDLYIQQGLYQKAGEYYVPLEEALRQKYDIERSQAIASVKAAYDTEKKNAEIEILKDKNRASRILLALSAIALALTVLSITMLVRQAKLRRKEYEERLYAMAVEAEQEKEERARMESESAQNSDVERVRSLLLQEIARLPDNAPFKAEAADRVAGVLSEGVMSLWKGSSGKLTLMDKKYSILFLSGLPYEDIAAFQNIETASVYTVRYRLRRKLPGGSAF